MEAFAVPLKLSARVSNGFEVELTMRQSMPSWGKTPEKISIWHLAFSI
jgi:hypothetical protein